MKYVKLFENFNEDIIEYLKDVLLPIRDNGEVEFYNIYYIDMFYIVCHSQNPNNNTDIEHIQSYMKDNGYDSFVSRADSGFTFITLLKPSDKNKELINVFKFKMHDLTISKSKNRLGDIFFKKGERTVIWHAQSPKGFRAATYRGEGCLFLDQDEVWSYFSPYCRSFTSMRAFFIYMMGTYFGLETFEPTRISAMDF